MALAAQQQPQPRRSQGAELPHTHTATHLSNLLEFGGVFPSRRKHRAPTHPETVARRAIKVLTPELQDVAESLGLRRPSRARAHASALLAVRFINLGRRLLADDLHGWVASVDRALRNATPQGVSLDAERLDALRQQVIDSLLVSLAGSLDSSFDLLLGIDHSETSCEIASNARLALSERWVTLAEEGIASGNSIAAIEALDLSRTADALPNVRLALHYALLARRWGADDPDIDNQLSYQSRLLDANCRVGAWKKAAKAGQRASELAADFLDTDDPRRLTIDCVYTRVLTECGRHDEALALARAIVWTCESEIGIPSRPAWEAYDLLAHVLDVTGESDEAVAVRLHRLETHGEGMIDASPRELIGAGLDLAGAYLRAGDGATAESSAREWLKCSESRLGPDEYLTHLLRGLVSSFD